jgi:hypothetical protein
MKERDNFFTLLHRAIGTPSQVIPKTAQLRRYDIRGGKKRSQDNSVSASGKCDDVSQKLSV